MKFKLYGKTNQMTLLGEVNGEFHVLYTTPLGVGNFQHVFDSDNPFPKKSKPSFEMPAKPAIENNDPQEPKLKTKKPD